MIPQVVTTDTVTVLRSNGTNFDQPNQPQPTHQRDYILKKHLRAEIKVIGAIQILCGVMVLSLGIILACAPFSPDFTPVFSSLLKSGYPFVGPVCFIVSGALSVITDKMSTKPLIHSSQALNVVSFVFGLVGFILLSLNLNDLDPALQNCELGIQPTVPYHYYHTSRSNECYLAKTTLAGVLGLMFVCTLVELVLAVLSAVLWWKQANADFLASVHFLSQSSYEKLNITNQELSQNTYQKLSRNKE